MGLIHWWPLNGDMKDHGLNPKNGSIIGSATVTEPGLTKYCLSGMSGSQTTAGVNVSNCNLLDEISNEYSAALWFKIHGTHVHYEGAFISSGNWNNQRWTFGITQANNRIQPLTNASNQNYISLGKTLTNERWYHAVTVYKDGTAYLYLDGELVGSVTATAPYQSSASNLTIGRETYAGGYFSFNGDICDVRIYDHALSAYEVEDLYRTKIIHYDFNQIYSETTKNLVTSLTKGGQTTANSSLGTITTTGVNADTYFYLNFSESLVQGETYTIQCIGENIGEGKQFTFGMGSQKSPDPFFTIKDGFNSYTFVSTANSSKNSLLFDDTNRSGWENKAVFSKFQVEKRDHYTDYVKTDNSSTHIFTDSSGFHNNLKSGDVIYSKDTNIGSYSLASPIVCENKSVGISSFTYNFWIKNNSDIVRDITLFSDGKITCGTTAATDYLSTTVTLSDSTTISATSNIQKMSLLSSKFHMITVTFDSASLKLYVDGTLHATTATTLNALSSTTDLSLLPNTENVLISDFKAYALALTSDQILDIYKEAGAVDNKGNLHAGEIIEVDESELDDHSPEVLNYNRQSKAESFEEGNDLFEVYKQSTEVENLVYITESTEVSGSFSYDSSYGNVVQFKSSDGTCTITFDKETQIMTWNSTGYFTGSINIPLLNPIAAGKKISMYVDYLDGDLIINPDTSVTNRFLQIGSLLTGGSWLHVDNRTSISDLTYNVLSNDSASLGYLRFNCHSTKTVNLRMRILIAESDTKITYFTPAIIDKETYISDYAIIKPTEIIEK